jgi:Outer membrane protein beta-barrel family/Carboxypeptidase regulatory-like domain
MRQFCFTFFFLSFSAIVIAQKNGSIKGIAFDTTSKQPVSNSTITLMQKKDSSLISFTMTDNSGKFELSGIPNGEYRLLITHVNYYNIIQLFKIDDGHKNIDLGNVIMNDRSKVLSEVVVTSEAPPVTLVGDTIQYNAGSFKTQPNANVEDLLKKLPGVKVEKDGTVKAQGEKVEKVLVNGKEFFGDDPKIATKNLPADAVDKVQVFDKLSDQAQLTGFDDGNSEKTINLKLKKDKKKGMFGKANAGGGTDGRYQGKFNINSFKGARQMSAIGMGNNTNAEGFSFMDILNFTGALNQLKNGGGNINISIGPDDPLAGLLGANNRGINTTFGDGVNYNNIIGNKTDFQSNYFYNRYNPEKTSNIQRQYFSPANLYKQNSYSDNLNNSHRLNLHADYQIDSFTSIKISPSLSYQATHNKISSNYITSSQQGTQINDGSSDNISNNEGYNFNTNILFRKKFRRRGRTFSLNLLTSLNNNSGDGNLNSITNFYDQSGLFIRSDSIKQTNELEGSLSGYNARAVYTEPVFKKSLLEFSLGKNNTKNTSSKTTHDYNPNNGKYDLINNLLTNDFKNIYGYNTGGLRFRKQTRNYNYTAGVSWQQSQLEGKIAGINKDSVIKKTFTNFLPNARFKFYFSRFKNILLNYNTSTNQPSVTQLQPVLDNSNPLYVKLGNPDLKQEFTHTLRLNASLVNPYRNRNLFAFFTLQQTQNKIVNYDRINNLGVDSVMPVNVNGVYNVNGTVSVGFPVHFLKGSLDISSNLLYYKDKQLLNDTTNKAFTNTINTLTLGPEIRLDMSPTEKLNLSLSTGISYSNSQYSIRTKGNSKYFNQEYSAEVDWQLPKGFYFATDFMYTVNGQHAEGFNARVPLWNASLSKLVLHFNRGEIKFSVKDILNQNIGISRSTNQNYIEDIRVNSLRRFFLLSFTYSLTKVGLNNEGGGGMKFIAR